MITKDEIGRINALYKKSKAYGLTDEEMSEQKYLREKYIEHIKLQVRSQLDNAQIHKDSGYNNETHSSSCKCHSHKN